MSIAIIALALLAAALGTALVLVVRWGMRAVEERADATEDRVAALAKIERLELEVSDAAARIDAAAEIETDLRNRLASTQRLYGAAREELTNRVHAQILGSRDNASAVVDGLLSLDLSGVHTSAAKDDRDPTGRTAVPLAKPTGADAIQVLK